MSQDQESTARKQLWDAGYMVQPAMGRDLLLLDSNQAKVAFATPRMQDGRWQITKLGGCLSFGTSARLVADSPHVGFLQLLGIRLAEEAVSEEPPDDPARTAEAEVPDGNSGDREDAAADRLSELGYQIAPFQRPGIEPAIALVKDGDSIGWVEPLPDGRWRAKKKGMARAMLGDSDAVHDTGPMSALCRLIGKPV